MFREKNVGSDIIFLCSKLCKKKCIQILYENQHLYFHYLMTYFTVATIIAAALKEEPQLD